MKVEITPHARGRMRRYNVSDEMLKSTIENPTTTIDSYMGRKICQRRLNG